MKNIQLLILIVIGLSFASCGVLKNGNKVTSEERIQVDAYAKAYIECEYKFVRLQYKENPNDRLLKESAIQLKDNVIAFRQEIFRKYGDVGNSRIKFNELVEASTKDITMCKQLEELKQSIIDKNNEDSKGGKTK